MTTPDEDITGYGGLGKTGSTAPDGSPAHATAGPSKENLKAKAREAGEEVKHQGKAQLENYRGTAADGLEKVARSAQAAAAELEKQDSSGLSHYVSEMAQSMAELADSLRGKSVDELVGEVNRIARNNPALFITGSIAVGFGLTRFARASSQRPATHEPTVDYGHSDAVRPHPTSPLGRSTAASATELPSQAELDERLSSGAPGAPVGSISNAGATTGPGTTRKPDSGKGNDGGLTR
ncbi:hypothetical protein N8H22_10960 [Stutzerimonas stutzeri]|uniref:hypothetical protein n=1 Tax=Stutzerimonas sp. S1 TaxID=3030652 RepID=UPI0022243EFB|nr:hypothetical protein [Stutzerimonas sp. S1]MCW3149113.1 hypothetical protein [Stutzerimonas sp. S1]